MKNVQKKLTLFFCAMLLIFASASVLAQSSDTSAVIKTSSQCEMCKTTIEKAMKKVSGVTSSDLNVETQELTVKFDSKKVKIDEIRTAINRAGYDADSTKADKRAYNKLHNCCKKPEDRK